MQFPHWMLLRNHFRHQLHQLDLQTLFKSAKQVNFMNRSINKFHHHLATTVSMNFVEGLKNWFYQPRGISKSITTTYLFTNWMQILYCQSLKSLQIQRCFSSYVILVGWFLQTLCLTTHLPTWHFPIYWNSSIVTRSVTVSHKS